VTVKVASPRESGGSRSSANLDSRCECAKCKRLASSSLHLSPCDVFFSGGNRFVFVGLQLPPRFLLILPSWVTVSVPITQMCIDVSSPKWRNSGRLWILF
jgi:hypothetical protein